MPNDEFDPIRFDLSEVDLHRRDRALELLTKRGAYYEFDGNDLVVPRKHVAGVANLLFPVDDGVQRWA